MSIRGKWSKRALAIGLVCLACQQIWRHGHDYVFADRFAEVVPGKVFRGAWQQTWPMKRILRDHDIKTVVALAHPPDHPLVVKERAIAAEAGVRWMHVPIVDQRTIENPILISDQLEKAAAIIADPENQPVYFHCHHGINRASMVQIAYRTIHCGWTLEQATEEISKTFGLVEVSKGPDYRHMERFYRERVLPKRAMTAASEREDRVSR